MDLPISSALRLRSEPAQGRSRPVAARHSRVSIGASTTEISMPVTYHPRRAYGTEPNDVRSPK
jgi:hypothetical protein